MVGDYGVEEWKDGGKCRKFLSIRREAKNGKFVDNMNLKICFQ